MVVGTSRGSWVWVWVKNNYDNSYETHCDICPMSYRVTPTSGEIAQKLGNFRQNIAFRS